MSWKALLLLFDIIYILFYFLINILLLLLLFKVASNVFLTARKYPEVPLKLR